METFECSRIWANTFSEESINSRNNELERNMCSRLKTAFFSLRERATTLAAEIGRDQPFLTVHDISHIDALWEMADKILGPNLVESSPAFFNPLEVFLLGASFLVHDLAQSRASLQLTDDELRKDLQFLDILKNSEEALHENTDKREVWDSAIASYLRDQHAILAEGLLTCFWLDGNGNGNRYYLLTDEDLRETFGPIIGRLAASHHWPVRRLQEEFGVSLGTPSLCSNNWTCDLFNIACTIRLCDASHFDARRAPRFLASLRKPQGISKQHWDFQGRLHKPRPEGDRLIYTSGTNFPLNQAEAWWCCFDNLSMLDAELAAVDAIRSDLHRKQFAIRAVAGIEDSRRLAKYIPTEGWVPIDTKIRVGDVANLVTRLGGRQLYGDDLTASLRELIQNAGDAVIARRILEGNGDDWGAIDVELHQQENGWLLKVTDSGVGMSEATLTGPLLDFGTSFWKSSESRKEFPGLQGKNFKSTGQYGIGFFSTFMLGEKVRVISRRYDLGYSDTRVIEFNDGANSRPILRVAKDDERSVLGTRVEILLETDPNERGGLLRDIGRQIGNLSLNELCAWLCPAFPVTIRTRESETIAWEVAVRANDWKTLPPQEFLKRIYKVDHEIIRNWHEVIMQASQFLRPLIADDGTMLGRASMHIGELENYMLHDCGVITVGGCRSETERNFLGMLTGKPTRASRDTAIPNVTWHEMQRWIEEQARLIENSGESDESKSRCVQYLKPFNVDLGKLPVAKTNVGWLNIDELLEYVKSFEKIWLCSHNSFSLVSRNRAVTLIPGVILCETSRASISNGFRLRREEPLPWLDSKFEFHFWTIEGLVIETIAKAWGKSLEEVLNASLSSDDENLLEAPIALDAFGHEVIEDGIDIIVKPEHGSLSLEPTSHPAPHSD